MTAEVLEALLWRARAALRVDGLAMTAGHGLADPQYRPPRLPHASVIGPLSYAVEPERDLPRQSVLTVRAPGYLAGATLSPATPVPPPGTVTLVLDEQVRATLALDHGADESQPLTADRARSLAERMQAALDGVLAGDVSTLDGTPVQDPARLDELRRTTVRWDELRRRLVIASGRHGPLGPDGAGVSSVRLDPEAPADQAAALGLVEGDPLASPPVPGAVAPAGRLIRHQVPSPIAMSFDLRVDLWAGSQRHLAAFVEAWARVTPTRCQLLLRPALLADDLAAGSRQLPLQAAGEPPTRWTIAQLEPGATFADRRTGRPVDLTGGAAPAADGLRLPTSGAATFPLLNPAAIADPLAPSDPAATGWAIACNLRADLAGADVADGDRMPVLELERDGRSVLRLDVAWAAPPGNGGPVAGIEARSETSDGTVLGPARLDVADEVLDAGVEVHALVDAVRGSVTVFAGGQPVAAPASGPVRLPAGPAVLRIGAAGAPVACTIGHVQVLTRPLGPVDVRHRRSLATSDRWRPGDPVTLTRTDDGFTPRGTAFAATVIGVTDTGVELDRPVMGDWPRHDTLVGSRVVFSQQTQIRRRDDLAMNLARMSVHHTVSAFLDVHDAGSSARLVEAIDLHVHDRIRMVVDGDDDPLPPSGRRRDGAPTVEGRIVPARVLVVHTPEEKEPPGADDIERVPEAPPADQTVAPG
jgi:hypothetical protein